VEVKRGKSVTKGDDNLGHELWIKVVKNKQAPPFRTAHATLIYGKGVPEEMSVLDMAIDYDVIVRKGSWLAYKGETLGQGKENVASYLKEHPDLMQEVAKEVKNKVAEGLDLILAPEIDKEDDGFSSGGTEVNLEEGVLELDVDEEE
jgi:recombination protein RecA